MATLNIRRIVLGGVFAFNMIAVCSAQQHQAYRYEAAPVDITIQQKGESRVPQGASAFMVDGHFVWGASVIQADDDKYYMIYTAPEANEHVFNQAWVLGSKMGVAVSSMPDKGFKHIAFFDNKDGFTPDMSAWDAQTVMNPHLRKYNDTYYLYYVGGADPGNVYVKSTASKLDTRSRIQQTLKIGVIAFNSFEELIQGKFHKPTEPLLSPRTRVKDNNIVDPSPAGTVPKPDNIIVVNPAVVFRPTDNKYLLYFKGNIYDPHWRGVHGVAIADSPMGPFVPLDRSVFTVEVGADEKLSAEDPYVWYCAKDKLFYAVFKDFTGRFTKGKPCLAMMYSEDGIDWLLPKHSEFMKKELLLASGEKVHVDRFERPQLLLDAEGVPIVLYAACSFGDINKKKDGSSFNVHIPIKRKPITTPSIIE